MSHHHEGHQGGCEAEGSFPTGLTGMREGMPTSKYGTYGLLLYQVDFLSKSRNQRRICLVATEETSK